MDAKSRNRLRQNWSQISGKREIAKYYKSQKVVNKAAKYLTHIFLIYFAFHAILGNFPFFSQKCFQGSPLWILYYEISENQTPGEKIKSCLELPDSQSKLKITEVKFFAACKDPLPVLGEVKHNVKETAKTSENLIQNPQKM